MYLSEVFFFLFLIYQNPIWLFWRVDPFFCWKVSLVNDENLDKVIYPKCFKNYLFYFWHMKWALHAQAYFEMIWNSTKVNKGPCYWVWNLWDKILACMKKDPSCFRKHPEQCFLRPDLKFFLEFQKKFWFAISVNLKMTIQNYFFVKKVCKKQSPIKFVGNFCHEKSTSGHILMSMKSMWKNICYLKWIVYFL